MPRPATLFMPHQMLAASTMATAIQSSPTPSRRCSGSRSRALLPTRRAAKPREVAATIQAAASACPTQPTRIRTGSRDLTGAGRRPRAVLLLARVLVRERLVLVLVFRGLAVVRVPERELAAGLRRAGPDGSARKSPESPPRDRAELLGARVAMMTTVTKTRAAPWDANGVSAAQGLAGSSGPAPRGGAL